MMTRSQRIEAARKAASPGGFEPGTALALARRSARGADAVTASSGAIGRRVFVQVPAATASVPGIQSVTAWGNAFYVVNTPYPVTIKTNLSPAQTYESQTGDAYAGTLDTIEVNIVKGQATNAFTVELWIGTSSVIGFLDGRILDSIENQEMICPVANAGIIVNGIAPIPAGTGNQLTINPDFTGLVDLRPQYQARDILLSNLDAANVLYVASNDTSNFPIVAVFPAQTIRVPWPYAISSIFTPGMIRETSGGLITINNPGAAAVNLMIGLVLRTNNYFLTGPNPAIGRA